MSVGCRQEQKETPLTNEERAQSAITAYLQQQLGPSSRYQSQHFSSLDTTYLPLNTDTLNAYMEASQLYMQMATDALFRDAELSGRYADSSSYFSNKAIDYIDHYPKIPSGWKMLHGYDAMVNGEMINTRSYFYLDSNFQITGSVPATLSTSNGSQLYAGRDFYH